MTFTYEKKAKGDDSVSVGESVRRILSKDQPNVSVGEIISDYGDKYTAEIRATLENNLGKYDDFFHVVVLHKKEPWALNVLRNWFVARKTAPLARDMWRDFPNFMHTVYRFDKNTSELKLLRSLPSPQEARVVLRNWELYDPSLVTWCRDAMKPTTEASS